MDVATLLTTDEDTFNSFVRERIESGELSSEQLREVKKLLQERKQYKEYNKSEHFKPYDYQKEFYKLGASKRWRMLCAGNRIGKTFSQAYEFYVHLTGQYPEWWEGRRFKRPIVTWFFGVTVDQCRDVGLLELIGTRDAKELENYGKGSIPRKFLNMESIDKDGSYLKNIKVKHFTDGVYDGESLITFKTSSADNKTRMGSQIDYIWCDELPPGDLGVETFGQLVTRTLIDPDDNASVALTGTPESGTIKLVQHVKEKSELENASIGFLQAGWKDAHVSVGGHITDKMMDDMIATIPAWEIPMRMNGDLILGDGMIFNYPIRSKCVIQPYELDGADIKRICAIDIGLGHNFAAVWAAYIPSTDTIIITDIFIENNTTPDIHAIAINKRGREIPVVLPRDAHQRQKDSGQDMIYAYRQAGVNVLPETFYNAGRTFDGTHNNYVDPGIVEMSQRIQSGQLQIFANCQELIKGLESYSYKKGVIDKTSKYDDVIDACRYAVMSVARRGKSLREMQTPYTFQSGWKTI